MIAKRNIRIFTWFNFLTDFRFYYPVAIIYFAKVSGSYALGMGIFSIIMLSSALFELPTGIFSDRIGRKKTVLLGSMFLTLGIFLYALGQYWLLVLGAIAEGISRSFWSGNNDAMLYDSLVEENRKDEYAEVLGKTSSPTQSSAAVVGILGGFIAYYSFKLSFWLSVIPPILCILLSFFLIEPKKHSKESTNIYAHLKEAVIKFKNNKQLRLLSLANIFSYGSGEAAFQFQSAFYSTIWPVWALGIAKTLSNVGAAISFHFSGRLIKKFTPLKILFLTEFYDNIVNFIAVVFKSVLSPILMSSTSLLFGVTVVASNTLMQKEFSDQQRATMGSLNSFLGSIFFAVFAVLVGLIGDKFGPAYVYMFVILFQIIPTFLYWKLYSKER